MRCLYPLTVRPKGYLRSLPVPCGQCANCKINSVNQWVFRCKEERKRAVSSKFITLTYDRKHLPRTANNLPTLRKEHVQEFVKKLRYEQSKTIEIPIKYIFVGEYGGLTNRPHYHAIIFNVISKEYIDAAWGRGYTDVDSVNSSTIAYTLKYIDKPRPGYRHSRDDRVQQFQLQSQGIGKGYLTKQQIEYHRTNPCRSYTMDFEGNRVPLSRYYAKKIFDTQAKKDIRHDKITESLKRLRDKQIAWFHRTFPKDERLFDEYMDLLRIQKQRKFEFTVKVHSKRNKI